MGARSEPIGVRAARTTGLFGAALGVSALARPARALNQYFFITDNSNTGSGTNFAAAPLLGNDPSLITAAQNTLNVSQAEGKPLAVRVNSPLTPGGAATGIFNSNPVQYVFGVLDGADSAKQTAILANQVQASSASRNAFVGNFGFYPGMQSDPTRQAATIDQYTLSLANMANPDLFPGSADFRSPAAGNSTAPNIRSALFTLPIERLTIATNELFGRGSSLSQTNNGSATDTAFAGGLKAGPNIPYVTRFNNFGNSALSNSAGTPEFPSPFVQNAANPANGQLPSRGDFEALTLHYRMRGADSLTLVPGAFKDATDNIYTGTQEQLDANTGWFVTGQPGSVENTVNGIFATHHFGFANLSNLVSLDSGRAGIAPLRTNFEALGVAVSGVYSEAPGSNGVTVGAAAFRDQFGVFHPAVPASDMALIISNLGNVTDTIDLGTIAGHYVFTPNDPNGIGQDDITIAAGTHRLVTFTLKDQAGLGLGTIAQQNANGLPVWDLTGNDLVFPDDNRNGTGSGVSIDALVPEPGSGALLVCVTAAAILRRRRVG